MNFNTEQVKDIQQTINKYAATSKSREQIDREERQRQKMIAFLKSGEPKQEKQIKSLW